MNLNRRYLIFSFSTLLVVSLFFGTFGSRDSRLHALIGVHTAHAADKVKYTCGMHPMIVVDEPGLCPICNMELTPLKDETAGGGAKTTGERKIKYWVAPMDPTYIRNEPGKSPMGMDLVPVYEDQAPGGSIITIDPVTSQNMGVRIAPAVRRDIHRQIRTVGLIAYDQPRQYSVNSKIEGWIEKLYVNETGQKVGKGTPLLAIYSPELVSAQEEFLLAKRNFSSLSASPFPEIADGAKRLLEASRRRLKLWDITDAQIAKLERTGEVQKTLTLYAPESGIVVMKTVMEGAYIKAGMELFQISDISRIWVNADIYEYELPWVKIGQKATVILPFAGGQSFEAKITYIYPYVEPQTRTVKARIELPNPGFELKPDMFVNVRLEAQTIKDALAVPTEAVIHSGEKRLVFVSLGNGKFEPRQIKTGLQGEDDYVEVKQGLLDGEKVVVSAQFMLDSESQLREAISKMLEPKKEEPPKENLDDLFGNDKKEDLEKLF